MNQHPKKNLEEMKEDFIWILTHQLRTLITPVKLYSDMLLTDRAGSLTAKQRSYIEDIHQAASRLVEVVRDIMNGYRIQSGEIEIMYESTCLCDMIGAIVKEVCILESNTSCDIRIEKSEQSTRRILIDQILTRQVLLILLKNAIKYSPKGRCAIGVSLQFDDTNGVVLIRVTDKGIGIPKEAWPHILIKPFRASNVFKMHPDGLGFDLYVAKLIITRLGGDMWFESEPDKGTKFFISLPLNPTR